MPDTNAEPLDQGDDVELGYLLRLAAGVHRIRMDRALHDIGVTAPQFLVLRLVASHPGCSAAELARLALLTMPTVSVIVGKLLHCGLLSRRAHATHGRILHLDVTPAGTDMLAQCKARAAPVEAELKKGLAAGDARRIRAWLVRATHVEEAAAGRVMDEA